MAKKIKVRQKIVRTVDGGYDKGKPIISAILECGHTVIRHSYYVPTQLYCNCEYCRREKKEQEKSNQKQS